jgi:hypothetical protein
MRQRSQAGISDHQRRVRGRTLLIGALVLVLLVVPISVADSTVQPANHQPMASPAVKKKLKKLRKQVRTLKQQAATFQQRLTELEGELGASRPPAGPAGGDLTGDYPDPQIAANAVGAAEVAPDALTGADVAEQTLFNDNSLTGEDINEATLGRVPEASQAINANVAQNSLNTNGLQLRAFHYSEAAATSQRSFLSLSGLAIGATCFTGGNIRVDAGTAVNDSYIRTTGDAPQADTDWDTTEVHTVTINPGVFQIAYRRGPASAGSTTFDSRTATVTISVDESAAGCLAAGTALGRP